MSACIRGHKRPMLNSHVGMEIRLSFYAMSALSRLHRVRRQCVNECTLCESTSSLSLRIKEIKNERALSLTLTFPFFLVHSVFTAPCNQHLCLFFWQGRTYCTELPGDIVVFMIALFSI